MAMHASAALCASLLTLTVLRTQSVVHFIETSSLVTAEDDREADLILGTTDSIGDGVAQSLSRPFQR
jgi:hypothetical protein